MVEIHSMMENPFCAELAIWRNLAGSYSAEGGMDGWTYKGVWTALRHEMCVRGGHGCEMGYCDWAGVLSVVIEDGPSKMDVLDIWSVSV